ncbi:hypothetical protein, partial [Dissulfurimicrobium sp.]
MKKLKIICTILTILIIPSSSYADQLQDKHMGQMISCIGCEKHRKQMIEARIQKLQKELNLSNAQVEKIRAIKKEGFEAFRNARKNLKNPMLEATKSPIFDKAVFISTAVDNTKTLAQIRAENFEKFY